MPKSPLSRAKSQTKRKSPAVSSNSKSAKAKAATGKSLGKSTKEKAATKAGSKSSAKASAPKAGALKQTNKQEAYTQETLRIVLKTLDDMKAEDAVTIDLAGKASFGDYMVIASGRSQRHVASIAGEVARNLKLAGRQGVHAEGKQTADWVLIDAGDVIIHVFRPDVRAFYNLEKMWSPRH